MLHDRQVFLKTFVASNIYWSGFWGCLQWLDIIHVQPDCFSPPALNKNHPRPNWSLLRLPCWKRSGVRYCRPIARIAWSVRTKRTIEGPMVFLRSSKSSKSVFVCLFLRFFPLHLKSPLSCFESKLPRQNSQSDVIIDNRFEKFSYLI